MKIIIVFVFLCVAIFILGAIANLLKFSSLLFFKREFNNNLILQFVFYFFLTIVSITFLFENPQFFEIKVVPNNQMIEKEKIQQSEL